MKLVMILGNVAVGKMTVGQELSKLTGLRLFHNHVMYEVVLEHLGDNFGNLSDRLIDVVYDEFSKSDNYGMIITRVMRFDSQPDWDRLNYIIDVFKEAGAEIYCIELVASQEIRLQRNKTENRLINKASKRDIDKSDKHLISIDKIGRFESGEGEITFDNYMKIDNSTLTPDITAKIIKDKFSL